jgi:type IV pilus assembly protein PilM
MPAWGRNRLLPIGLFLGDRSATLLQLSQSGGRFQVHAKAHGPLPVNENASPDEHDRQVAAALRRMLSDHPFRGRNVVSCLGSQELFVQNVRLPKLPPEEIEKVIRWEAEERLPYGIEEAEIRHLLAGEVRQDANIKQEVILLACHQGVLRRHLALLETAGLTPAAIDVEPCALLRALQDAEAAADARRAYIHLGERATTVIFAEGTQILFLKYITTGGQQFDQAVARHLNLPVEEAARLRADISAGASSESRDEVQKNVFEALRAPLEQVGSEIELCLRYYKVTFRGRPLERVILTGEEAYPWMLDFWSSRVGAPCFMGDPFSRLKNPQAGDGDLPGRWSTAVGLSLKPTAA